MSNLLSVNEFKSVAGYTWRIVVVLLLCLAILLPRILPFLPTFTTFDEITIGSQVNDMAQAIRGEDWQNTLQGAYPAVTLAWLEVAQIGISQLLPEPLPSRGAMSHQELFDSFPRQRLALALLNSLIIFVVFWLLWRIYDSFTATSAIILLAFDPFLLTQSRVMRADGLMVGLMLLSVLFLVLYLKEKRKLWLIVSGIVGGLALLTKITALYLIPFTGLTITLVSSGWLPLNNKQSLVTTLKQIGQALSLWGASIGFTFFMLWPALWVAPVTTIRNFYAIIERASSMSSTWGSRDGSFFFQGEIINTNPGVSFYLWVLAYRTTPLVCLGIVALFGSGILLFWRWRTENKQYSIKSSDRLFLFSILILVMFIAFYFIGINFPEAKVERYLLPVFPGLAILAALGFVSLLRLYPIIAKNKLSQWGVCIILFVSSAGTALPHHPYYFTYWNPLWGGGQQAVKILPVGNGEGMDVMVKYLNSLPNASNLSLFRVGVLNCWATFLGKCADQSELLNSDYFVTDIFSVQRKEYLANLPKIAPDLKLVHKYSKNGLDYAWLYEMPESLQPAEQWVERHGRFNGYRLAAIDVSAGDDLQISLFWQNGEDGWTLQNSEFFAKLMGGEGQVWRTVSLPLRSESLPRQSDPNELLIFTGIIDIPPDTPLGTYTIEIGLRLRSTKQETWQFDLSDTSNAIVVSGGIVMPAVETFPVQHRVEQSVGDNRLVLVGYNIFADNEPPRFDVYWQLKQPITEDYLLNLVLRNNQDQVEVQWSDTFFSPDYGPGEWQVNEIIGISFPLVVGHIPLSQFNQALLYLYQVGDTRNIPLTFIKLDSLPENFALQLPRINMQHRFSDATFGSYLDLLGYDLLGRRGQTEAGGVLSVKLYWLNRQFQKPVEMTIEALNSNDGLIAKEILFVPASTREANWYVNTQTDLQMSDLPAKIVIKADLSPDQAEYSPSTSRPITQQIAIDNVAEKIMILE